MRGQSVQHMSVVGTFSRPLNSGNSPKLRRSKLVESANKLPVDNNCRLYSYACLLSNFCVPNSRVEKGGACLSTALLAYLV